MGEPTGSISVVVPVYNGERSLDELIRRLEPVLEGETVRYEVILVDDDSRDGSWERIRELARARPWVHGMRLTRNYGQHNANLCGFLHADGDYVVTMDDDLQNPPEEIIQGYLSQQRSQS